MTRAMTNPMNGILRLWKEKLLLGTNNLDKQLISRELTLCFFVNIIVQVIITVMHTTPLRNRKTVVLYRVTLIYASLCFIFGSRMGQNIFFNWTNICKQLLFPIEHPKIVLYLLSLVWGCVINRNPKYDLDLDLVFVNIPFNLGWPWINFKCCIFFINFHIKPQRSKTF